MSLSCEYVHLSGRPSAYGITPWNVSPANTSRIPHREATGEQDRIRYAIVDYPPSANVLAVIASNVQAAQVTNDLETFEVLLTSYYAAFNRRDVPVLLAAMTPDVAWPNGWEGGVVRGRADVNEYWRRQWEEIDPIVTPTAFSIEADGRVAVTVDQVVRDRAGAVLFERTVLHVYRFDNGLISEMEIRE